MVKIIKAENQKMGWSRSGAKRWSVREQKKKGKKKKTHGRKVCVPKGGEVSRWNGSVRVVGTSSCAQGWRKGVGNFPLYFYKAVEVR